jgi:hypothetical protein
MGNATHRIKTRARPPRQKNADPCGQIVNWSIGALILANLLFLGQKIPVPSLIAKPRTQVGLERTAKALEAWRAANGTYPATLGEMMASPEIRATRPGFHDASGNRFEYIRTGFDRFILRSFGSDSVPATLASGNDDIILESATSRYAGGMVLTNQPPAAASSSLEFFTWPPAAAEGLWSPDGHWLARIASNPATAERRVVVISEDHQRVLVSPHDRIEEFLWEQGTSEPALIFTATGSELYDDGIYRWRLSSSQPGDALKMENLIDEKMADSLPGHLGGGNSAAAVSRKKRWVLALLQSSGTTNALAVPESELIASGGQRKFLDSANVLICPPDGTKCVTNARLQSKQAVFRLALDQTHRTRGTITPGQRTWSKLPTRGKAAELIHAWKSGAGEDAIDVLRPYVLFFSVMLQDQILATRPVTMAPGTIQHLRASNEENMADLLKSQETPRYLQALLVGGDRPALRNMGYGSRPVFEITDARFKEIRTDDRKEKAEAGKKTRD